MATELRKLETPPPKRSTEEQQKTTVLKRDLSKAGTDR